MRRISWLAAEPVSFSRRTLLHGVSKSKTLWCIKWPLCFKGLIKALLGNTEAGMQLVDQTDTTPNGKQYVIEHVCLSITSVSSSRITLRVNCFIFCVICRLLSSVCTFQVLSVAWPNAAVYTDCKFLTVCLPDVRADNVSLAIARGHKLSRLGSFAIIFCYTALNGWIL